METIIIMVLAIIAGIFINIKMRKAKCSSVQIIIVCMIVGGLIGFFIPKITNAQTINMTASVRWNNTNLHTTQHPKPLSFNETETGYLANMADGSQVVFTWLIGRSLLRIDWEDAWFHICNGGAYYAEDLRGLSICLSNLEV
ncbi:MAG: hypothetical protein KAS04_01260 [Candidatus Aenigmarchaeota archaeon]|nr:hypothetical protein [Candidatus Aenigmarchaeota archaeon]